MKGLIQLLIVAFIIASLWKVFTKAGRPGWAAIIPIYNAYILIQIVSKPVWWLILMFIPLVNLIIMFILDLELAKRFAKGTGFAVGLFFLPFIFFPILAFSDAQYSPASKV
ncbi:MAG: hypothetical protein BWY69_00789 [Planctomycetes bacterium ADurb.Bin401]|nr:MAG: hypothetical protein BWY69_00789 [Planctomycetes bacterium ADurb.Bin401]